MINTPLLEEILKLYSKTQISPMIEVGAVSVMRDGGGAKIGESMLIDAGKGISVSYGQQMEPGIEGFVETILVSSRTKEGRAGEEQIIREPKPQRFAVRDGVCYLLKEGSGKSTEEQEYKEPWVDVNEMINSVRDERMEKIATALFKARQSEFDDLTYLKCDHVYLLRRGLGGVLVYLGDRGFIETIRKGKLLEDGVVNAYKKYESQSTWEQISGYGKLAEKLRPGSVALIMSEKDAQELIIETPFDDEYLKKGMLRIGQTDVHLVGRAKVFAEKFVDFVNRQGMSTKEFVMRSYEMPVTSVEDAIARVMKAELTEEKQDGKKTQKRPEMTDPRADITMEIPQSSIDQFIYNIYKLWLGVSDKVGPVFEGSLKDKPGRKDEWKTQFARVLIPAYNKIRDLDYSMFLNISQERLPEPGADNRRVGVGNIILDFGGRQVLERILDIGAPALIPRNIETAYCHNLENMNAYMFRGRILRPMLRKILSKCKPGERVLIDTCKERVEEIARFCQAGEREGTLMHNGVELMFTNDEALKALEEIRKKG
jgi:hypothetical protein